MVAVSEANGLRDEAMREAVGRWLSYVVHATPDYDIEPVAAALGASVGDVRSVAQSMLPESVGGRWDGEISEENQAI